MSNQKVWEEIYSRFDPDLPAQQASWRADRERSPARVISQSLGRPHAQPRILMTGTVGTGKSTELLRIAETQSARDFVIFLDLRRHFREVVGDEQALQTISSWEVIFLVGLSVVRAASELVSHAPIPSDYIENLKDSWQNAARKSSTENPASDIDIGALAKTVAIIISAAEPLLALPPATSSALNAGMNVLEAAADALKWHLPIGRKKRRPLIDQDEETQNLLVCVNRIIRYVETKTRRILFIIDGLDRITKIDRANSIFIESEIIPQLACALVVTGPFALRSHPAVAMVPRFTLVRALVNEPVLDHKKPHHHGEGTDFFCDLFRKRVSDLNAADIIPDELLKKLAYYSGGRARDFVKFIRMVSERAWDADAIRATPKMIDEVIDEARRLMETGLDAGHIELLEQVAADPRHILPFDPKARELLSYGLLLPYPNESEWYYPHPLLTLHLVRTPSTGSTA